MTISFNNRSQSSAPLFTVGSRSQMSLDRQSKISLKYESVTDRNTLAMLYNDSHA